jgi:hypothetical protein
MSILRREIELFRRMVTEPRKTENGKEFFPKGAIFFFALLLLFYAVLWLGIYWIMIARS